jgi:peroxiredoxin
VAEVPELNAFYAKHQDKDVKLINIDIQESLAKVTAFAEKHKIKYTVVLDADGKVANQYEVYGIPTIMLVDEDGIIKYRGSKPKAGFEELLK